MSETPRTDNFIADNDIFCDSKELLLFTNFAQQLETELAEARAEIERLKKALEKIIYQTSQQYYRESEKHVRIANEIAKTAMAAEGDKKK